MNFIDKFLNSITMYRLTLTALSFLSMVAIVLGFVGLIPYSGLSLIVSLAVILAVSYGSNVLFSIIYKAPRNVESAWITGFILFFLCMPSLSVMGLATAAFVALVAMLSKYILSHKGRHLFNPAAIAAVIVGFAGNGIIIWWVAGPILNILTLVIGLLIVRKIGRFAVFWAFVISALGLAIFTYVLPSNVPALSFAKEVIFGWQLIFFATIMLIEPQTMPPTKKKQIIYGVIIGLLFSSKLHVGSVYATPELALVIGNIYAYFVSLKQKVFLRLRERRQLADGIYEFIFKTDWKPKFAAGQYMEWTLPHDKADIRGVRRFFTIASSPTEKDLHLAVRIAHEKSSTFKQQLMSLSQGAKMTIAGLDGEFVLPKDPREKIAFIAGGIGVTPFRSMVKYLADIGERRNIALFYQAATDNDFAYKDLFKEIKDSIGMKTVYIATKPSDNWQGRSGYITEDLIKEITPDFKERTFYLSGPEAMVNNYENMLKKMGVRKIVTDYFPGY